MIQPLLNNEFVFQPSGTTVTDSAMAIGRNRSTREAKSRKSFRQSGHKVILNNAVGPAIRPAQPTHAWRRHVAGFSESRPGKGWRQDNGLPRTPLRRPDDVPPGNRLGSSGLPGREVTHSRRACGRCSPAWGLTPPDRDAPSWLILDDAQVLFGQPGPRSSAARVYSLGAGPSTLCFLSAVRSSVGSTSTTTLDRPTTSPSASKL